MHLGIWPIEPTRLMLLITLFFSRIRPTYAQLDNVEPINQDQYQVFEDERDDHCTERDDAQPYEVHKICDPGAPAQGRKINHWFKSKF